MRGRAILLGLVLGLLSVLWSVDAHAQPTTTTEPTTTTTTEPTTTTTAPTTTTTTIDYDALEPHAETVSAGLLTFFGGLIVGGGLMLSLRAIGRG